MAWETRSRGGLYYTRSCWAGGRVVREYLGSGETARLIARLDELDQAERAITRATELAERERLRTFDRSLDAFCRQVDAILRETLEAVGYHQHARGAWRKRRGQDKDRPDAGARDPREATGRLDPGASPKG